jgi:DNA-binding transcriptional LysR family regulator
MLDPRRLSLLRDVAATGTIAAAAERAGCTAAAASQQLAALERDLGAGLLERSARSVRLTEAGRVLAEHAGRLLSSLADAERAVRDVAGLRGGTIRIAAFATAAISFVIPALTVFRRRHPDVEVRFTELESAEALPEVRAGTVDLAVTHEYAPLSRPDLHGLEQRALYREPMLLAVPRSLEPAGTGKIDLADFAATPWVAALTSSGFQAATEMACRAAGFEPRVECRVHSYPMVLAMVGAGFGVGLVPQLAAVAQSGVSYLPIARPTGLTRQIYATTRRTDQSPAARAFVRCLRETLRPPVETPGCSPSAQS